MTPVEAGDAKRDDQHADADADADADAERQVGDVDGRKRLACHDKKASCDSE